MFQSHRVKIFISYSRKDQDLIDTLVKWLNRNGYDPIVDKREIKAGDQLDMKLKAMIDQSDVFLAVGTPNYMNSDWCKKEVEYACHKRKEYLPVLFEHIERINITDWFTRVGSPEGEVVYAECYDMDFKSIETFLRHLSKKAPIKLKSAVLIGLVFLFIFPSVASIMFH